MQHCFNKKLNIILYKSSRLIKLHNNQLNRLRAVVARKIKQASTGLYFLGVSLV